MKINDRFLPVKSQQTIKDRSNHTLLWKLIQCRSNNDLPKHLSGQPDVSVLLVVVFSRNFSYCLWCNQCPTDFGMYGGVWKLVDCFLCGFSKDMYDNRSWMWVYLQRWNNQVIWNKCWSVWLNVTFALIYIYYGLALQSLITQLPSWVVPCVCHTSKISCWRLGT